VRVWLRRGPSCASACQERRTPVTAPAAPAPVVALAAAPAVPRARPSPRREPELETFYRRVEANLRAQGLLRTDGGRADAPFDAEDLARNFERIALFEEYANVGGRIVARQTPSQLSRWERPVLVQLEFGAGVPAAKVNRDRISVAAFAARLGAGHGHPVRIVPFGGQLPRLHRQRGRPPAPRSPAPRHHPRHQPGRSTPSSTCRARPTASSRLGSERRRRPTRRRWR
jgi:hypothetical protein